MPRAVSNLRFVPTDEFGFSPGALQSTFMPAFTPLPNGGFVAVWTEVISGTMTVVGQRYDAAGRTVGDDFAVGGGPETTSPQVATLSSGGFVVSWSQNGNVKGRLYDAAGDPVDTQFTANTVQNGVQVSSQVAGLAGGGFVITWHDSHNGTFDNIHGQVFAEDGQKIGGEFIGGDATPGVEEYSGLVALSGGGFVVSWFQPGGDSSFGYGTRAQVFDAAGNKLGGAFTLNTITEGTQQSPELSALPDGGFVAVWVNGSNGAASDQGIWAQMFDASGNKVGDDIHVDIGSDQADVAVIPGIGFAVIWKELSDASSDTFGKLRVQIFDFDGNRTGEEFSVETGVYGIQNLPDITALESGAFLVSWLNWEAPQSSEEYPMARIFFPTIMGTENADIMAGSANRDFFFGLDGGDNLAGGAEDDALDGGNGADFLNGGLGVDELIGGAGDDTYVVDRIEDQVLENIGGGNDTVFTGVSFVLSSNQEIETLTTQTHAGTENLFLTGNQLNNTLVGNAGNNIMNGVGGADVMYGLHGDDTYAIDHLGDLVVDLEGQGNDLVYTYISHTLSNGNQIETLSTVFHTRTDAITLGGNDYNNTLIGNYGANYINGNGGVDTMIGLNGDDTYVVDNTLDIVEEIAGGGNDTLFSFVTYVLAAGKEVETLSSAVQGATTAIGLQGNEFGQTIIANNGNNTLDGGLGNDVLIGLGGVDIFYFRSALGINNIDAIADFASGTDKIGLDQNIFALDASFGLGQRFSNQGVAQDADDRIIYNQATGQLFYDADGNGAGAQVQFAIVTGAPPLASSDFMIF